MSRLLMRKREREKEREDIATEISGQTCAAHHDSHLCTKRLKLQDNIQIDSLTVFVKSEKKNFCSSHCSHKLATMTLVYLYMTTEYV